MRNWPRLSISISRSSLDRHLRRAVAHISKFVRACTLRRLATGLAAAIAVSGAGEVSETVIDSQEKAVLFKRTKSKLAILAISTVGLGLGGNAVANADNTENADGQRTSASSTLGPHALKKLCVKAGLRMPVIEQGGVSKSENITGTFNLQNGQEWTEMQHWRLVPDDCNGSYKRYSWIKLEVQNHTNHKQWQGVYRPRWKFIQASNRGFGDQSDRNYLGYDDFTAQSLLVSPPKSAKTPYYRCTPGPGKTKARIKIRNRVKDEQTGKFVGQRVGKFPTKVVRAC